jgi:hypothetical protein
MIRPLNRDRNGLKMNNGFSPRDRPDSKSRSKAKTAEDAKGTAGIKISSTSLIVKKREDRW